MAHPAISLATVSLCVLLLPWFAPYHADAQIVILDKLDIARVWAGHPVNFDVETKDTFQCVAYYDTLRRMIVASRSTTARTWTRTVLPTTTGWDSHNYIEMAIDDSGYVHISGNMHNVPLIYFRSRQPYSIAAFDRPGMVGTLESSVTYPVFIRGPDKRLLFQYRDGGSGSGTTIWNGYDLRTKRWTRITSQGLFDGEGQVNAYPADPVLGPDGCFHVIWMWRDTPVANTNHHLSHIKSRDLVTWQTMAGQSVTLPVKQSTPGVVVDPITSGHGLINMDFWISWDSNDRAVVTYHRYDASDISQIWNTRRENNSWRIYQTSSWTSFKWNLDRTGSLSHDIAATPLETDAGGRLLQYYVYRDNIKRLWVLNETSMRPLSDSIWRPPSGQEEIYRVVSTWPGMQVNLKKQDEYWIRWESLPINQDQPRDTYPSGSTLTVYRMGIQSKANPCRSISGIPAIRYRVVSENLEITMPGVNSMHAILMKLDGSIAGKAATTAGNKLKLRSPGKGCYILLVKDSKTGNAVARRMVVRY